MFVKKEKRGEEHRVAERPTTQSTNRAWAAWTAAFHCSPSALLPSAVSSAVLSGCSSLCLLSGGGAPPQLGEGQHHMAPVGVVKERLTRTRKRHLSSDWCAHLLHVDCASARFRQLRRWVACLLPPTDTPQATAVHRIFVSPSDVSMAVEGWPGALGPGPCGADVNDMSCRRSFVFNETFWER